MEELKIALMILFVADCIALTILVLSQEGKAVGLGTIGGMADSFWSKNKSRTREGRLLKYTRVCAALFIVLALVLNLKVFA